MAFALAGAVRVVFCGDRLDPEMQNPPYEGGTHPAKPGEDWWRGNPNLIPQALFCKRNLATPLLCLSSGPIRRFTRTEGEEFVEFSEAVDTAREGVRAAKGRPPGPQRQGADHDGGACL